MQCPQCQRENRAVAKFCEECGTRLAHTCPSCGHEVRPQAKFCEECGTSLMASTSASQAAKPETLEVTLEDQTWQAESPISDAERRQLTVMFCDLVGSTPLSEQLDPEDLREVVRAYQQTCADVIERFDGYIAQHLGDGLMVYFGWPQAHEDDAQGSVHAGLGIVEAMGQLNTRLEQEKGIRLAVRIGIHTGLVVVGEMGGGGHQERLALGETPNVASRIQGLAEPDTLVISDATYRLIEGYFDCNELGLHTLKGIAEPQQVYRVIGENEARSRLDIVRARGLTPLVGRKSEVTLLLERWNQVQDGQGQVVLISGEGGIGKSRLVQVIKDRVAREASMRVECQCSPYYRHTAFYPVVSHFQRLLRWQRDDTPEAKLNKLEKVLAPYACFQPDMVPLFASLLAFPLPERYPPLPLTPQRQKQQAMEAWLTWLLARADRRTILLVIEDLQWVDPSTLELLDLLIDQTPTISIFMLLTCRATFQPPWSGRSYLTQMTLNRLSRTQVEQMVERITGRKRLPADVLQRIVEKIDGVPLFVEEMTKAVLESGFLQEGDGHYALTGPLPSFSIPATLHDSLMARLDRLVTAKGVAQLGSVMGRQFSYELLQAVSQLDEPTLLRELRRLVEAELLYQRGLPPQATYTFKHALIQDAAYQALLKSTRQQYHQRIAQVLAEQFPETLETQPELLAHHYTEAGHDDDAISYWQRAGQRAFQHSAYVEAIAHLRQGLALLTTLPETPVRLQQELDLQVALGPALRYTQGHAAPDMERTYARARELCQQLGDTPQLFSVLRGLSFYHFSQGQLQTATPLVEQLLRLAQLQSEPVLLLLAHFQLGLACGNSRVSARRPPTSSPQYTDGSPRDSIRRICRTPRHSLTNWLNLVPAMLCPVD